MLKKIKKLKNDFFLRYIAHSFAKAMQLNTQRNKIICCDHIIEADTSPQDEFELFKYIYENGRDTFEPYYIINEKCTAYDEIKAKYGDNIIPFSRDKINELALTLKELFKTTKFICDGFQVCHGLHIGISEAVKRSPYVYYIFTQHGITFFKDDFIRQSAYSSFIFDKLMISNDIEKEIFINRGCHEEKNLVKNGLFRWDKLSSDNAVSEKSIFIYFTHRRYLGCMSEEEIKNSVYFKSILNFLENPRFKKFVEENGYTLKIALHHSILRICGSEMLNGLQILEDDDIADAKKTASILITDYSSMCFEMWFQHKPSIFLNIPDGEDCLKYGHSTDLADPYTPKKKYIFNIVNTVDECMDKLIDYHNTNFKLKPDEKAKRDAFFYYNGDFRKRFYEYLLSMKDSVKQLYHIPVNTSFSFARYPEFECFNVEFPTFDGRWIVREKAFVKFFVPKWDNGISIQLYVEPFFMGKQDKIPVKITANGYKAYENTITENKNCHITFDIPKEKIGNEGKIQLDFKFSDIYPHNELDPSIAHDHRQLSFRLINMDVYEKSEKSADTLKNIRIGREKESENK